MDDLLPIGTMAKRSGLSVRALRLYDGLGLLRPVDVDPATGYRRYAEEQVAPAVLIARLREADVPLPEVTAILAEPDGPSRRARLEHWWSAREHDVLRQRDLVAALGRRLEQETLMPITTHQIDAAVLAEALTAVLRSVSTDATAPVITGVYVEPSADTLRLVATDKFRLAIWDLPASSSGGQPMLLEGAALQALLGELGVGTVAIEVTEDAVVFRHGDTDVSIPMIAGVYPQYRALLPTSGSAATVTVDRVALEEAVRSVGGDAVHLEPTKAGLRVWTVDGDSADVPARHDGTPCTVALNAGFLLDGLASFPHAATVTLDMADPIKPLTLRAPDNDATYLLMPIRMDAAAPA